jgi:proline iminopeptidase
VTDPATAHPRTGEIEVGGARLPYRIEGRGQPCLVLGSVAYYSRVFSQSLRDHLQLVFVDLRHFAASDSAFSPDVVSIDLYTADVERVRQVLGLDDVVVIGHSVHATIALEFARRYPAHVRGVVMVGSSPVGIDDEDRAADDQYWREASEDRRTLRARTRAELTPELKASLAPSDYFVREYAAAGPLHWYDMTYDGTWLWEGTELNMPVLERLYAAVDHLTLAAGEVTTPVLIVHGRYDYGSPPVLWERHREKLPAHTFVVFDKSGHTPPLEEPELVDETLLAWVGELEPAGDGSPAS